MPNAMLDPTGRGPAAGAPAAAPLAPRRPDLTGARVGLLENTKQNAALFLPVFVHTLPRWNNAFHWLGKPRRNKRHSTQPVLTSHKARLV